MELIRISNKGRRPFDFMHRNQKKIILPGDSMIVPFDLAASLFGDPRTKDMNGDNARKKVYDKVRGHFGFAPGLQSEEEWQAMRPNLTFEDVETGEKVLMLVDDPFNQNAIVSGTEKAEANDRAAERSQMEQLMAQVATLTQTIANMQQEASTPGNSSSNTPTDDSAPPQAASLEEQLGNAVSESELTPGDDTPPEVPSDDAPPTPVKKTAAKKTAAKK